MANARTIALEILGDDYVGIDSVLEVLNSDKIGSTSYSEETYRAHLTAISEKEGYVKFISSLKAQPGMQMMYAFMITGGPASVYNLLETMGGFGLVDKKRAASAAKISAPKTVKEKPWHKRLFLDLSQKIHASAQAIFNENLEEYKKAYPELGDVKNLDEYFWACGKSAVSQGVSTMDVTQTGKKCTVALIYRLDAHSPARNGGWDSRALDGAGDFTKEYKEKKVEAAAKAVAKDAAEEKEEDTAAEEAVEVTSTPEDDAGVAGTVN